MQHKESFFTWGNFISEEKYVPYLLSFLAWTAIITLFIYPLIYGIKISFLTSGKLSFNNYIRLFNDPIFWNAMWVTLIYVLMYTVGIMVTGFVIAFAIDLAEEWSIPGGKALSSVLTLPYAIPDVVGALIWLWMLNPRQGIINYLFSLLGISEIQWLTSVKIAPLSVVLVEVWRLFPMHALIILAAFKTVPRSLYEAASLDGASAVKQFFCITLPSIANIMKFLVLLTIVWSFKRFTMRWLMTQGGPMHSTETLSIFIYREAFMFFNKNYAAAASVILLLVVLLAVTMYLKFSKTNDKGDILP